MAKINQIIAISLLIPIKFYRTCISPLLPAHCRFYPTCSEYAVTALKKRNFLTACLLISYRLLKCHPCHPGGYDPVPEKMKE